jgi:hypothetical protein
VPINREPAKKELLWFGAGLVVFVAILGYLVGRRTGSEAVQQSVWTAGGAVAAVYWLIPASRRPIFVGFGYLTYPIGWIVTSVLLLAVFAAVVTPTGIVMRLLGRDLLERRVDKGRASYWIRHAGPRASEDYFRQF